MQSVESPVCSLTENSCGLARILALRGLQNSRRRGRTPLASFLLKTG